MSMGLPGSRNRSTLGTSLVMPSSGAGWQQRSAPEKASRACARSKRAWSSPHSGVREVEAGLELAAFDVLTLEVTRIGGVSGWREAAGSEVPV
jgi:hypothetical protein